MSATSRKSGSREVSTEVYNEQLALMLEQSYAAVFLGTLAALLLVFALWSEQESGRLLLWFGAVVVSAGLRALVYRSYRRTPPFEPPLSRRELVYRLTTMLYFAAWGFGGVWILPAGSLLEPLIVLYFLIGLAGSAVAVFSASRFIQLTAVVLVLVPITAWFLLQGTTQSAVLAVASILFLLSTVRSSKILADTIELNFSLKHRLGKAKAEAEHLARVDELTQLFNRRAFYEHARMLWLQAQRSGNPLSLLLLDIDFFKQINDTHGHGVGDEALIYVANTVAGAVRESDICGRVGGEEFAVLLPDTDLAQALVVAESLREKLAASHFEFPDGPAAITASLGLAQFNGEVGDMMREADAALYRAKEAGRNRVEAVAFEAQEQIA